jgi:3-methylcrotonyl-CoA carboxylase alpha subunit
LLAKLVVWDKDRTSAISRMQKLMSQITISGVHSNLSFLSGLIKSESIQKNNIYTRYLDENLDNINQQINQEREQQNKQLLVIAFLIFHFLKKEHNGNSVWNQIGFWRMNPQFEVSIEGKVYKCWFESAQQGPTFRFSDQEYHVTGWQFKGFQLEIQFEHQIQTFRCMDGKGQTLIEYNGFQFELQSNSLQNQASVIRENKETLKIFQNLICADLFGKVLKLNVHAGDIVDSGQILLTLESMKTEIHVLCPAKARIKGIYVNVGDSVTEKQLLVELEEIGLLAQ